MIQVSPQLQTRENQVRRCDGAVPVASQLRSIVHCQGEKSVSRGRWWLRGGVPKQLGAIVNSSIPVAIERQESIITSKGSPGSVLEATISVQIKINARIGIRQPEPVVVQIQKNGTTRVDAPALPVIPGAVSLLAEVKSSTPPRVENHISVGDYASERALFHPSTLGDLQLAVNFPFQGPVGGPLPEGP